MTTQIGLVKQTGPNGFAAVQTDRQDACGGCHSTQNCRACLSGGDKLISQVLNPIGARPGDVVAIELESRDLLKGAALFYLFPIILLALGTLFGATIGTAAGMAETLGAIVFGMVGLALGLAAVKRITGSKAGLSRLSPRITRVVDLRAGAAGGKPRRPAKEHSCCR